MYDIPLTNVMDEKYKKIIEASGGKKIRLDEPLWEHTTFKIGGPADLFYEAGTEEDLIGVFRAAREIGIPCLVLGGGSNILVGDKGFRGLIVKLSNCELKIENEAVQAGAGLSMSFLLNSCKKNSLSGLEFMMGIPGTVGGAVRGNAGAWQQNVGDRVSRVKILSEEREVKWIEQKDCSYSYRNSRFKQRKEIILAIEFKMDKGEKVEIEKQMKAYSEKRSSLPKEPSAGCIFINPKPLSAGDLIDKCGLKGTQVGGAKISEKHANFIINVGGAKAADVVELINLAKQKVEEKFNIELMEEIVRVGEF